MGDGEEKEIKRETDRQRQTDRQRHTDRQRETHRETETERQRQTDRQTDRGGDEDAEADKQTANTALQPRSLSLTRHSCRYPFQSQISRLGREGGRSPGIGPYGPGRHDSEGRDDPTYWHDKKGPKTRAIKKYKKRGGGSVLGQGRGGGGGGRKGKGGGKEKKAREMEGERGGVHGGLREGPRLARSFCQPFSILFIYCVCKSVCYWNSI